jgi:hypothetical protein
VTPIPTRLIGLFNAASSRKKRMVPLDQPGKAAWPYGSDGFELTDIQGSGRSPDLLKYNHCATDRGRSPDWLKFKNPAAPAVKREAGRGLGKNRRRT